MNMWLLGLWMLMGMLVIFTLALALRVCDLERHAGTIHYTDCDTIEAWFRK